ncbi:MAG TPA: flagellar basal body P-ring formation chaperone FlgA [Stellaceae bacterium]|nr:flagellar basal body P-ring formation chaperone FlgA [Stellaceae bacterium]
MIRFVLFFLAAAVALAASARAETTLKPVAVVQGSVIRIGDLFSDAGSRAGDVVAPAPPPGARTIFDSQWLAAAAREHHVDWQPASRFDQAAVERASRLVAADAVTAALLDEIRARQPLDDGEIQLDNPAMRLTVAAEAPDTIGIEGLTVDPRTGRFSALIATPANDADAERQRVSGRVFRLVKVPTLNRAMTPGETIRAGDIAFLRLRADRTTGDVVAELAELVGRTPRHPLRAHEPLRAGDIQVPIVVHKGDLVTVFLETPLMRLSAQGKALEDGAMGAAIRIANTKSNRVIDAVVTGPNLAAIAAAAQLAAR